jgi:bifunctional non-homologous end joining protein LigD
MTLKKYQDKRDFDKTSEPKGKMSHTTHHMYIIQKHAASHLHYDFRLELNGVLKSWAVPKGPSLNPTVKRLAMHVEDHPVEYGFFEGIIPKGQYGGGTVMLWDKGLWIPLDNNPEQAYEKGHLRFELKAEKLNGRWDLIRFKDQQHWFLIKHQDAQANLVEDITKEQPNSVLTQLSIEEISQHYEKIWTTKGATKAAKTSFAPLLTLPSSLKPQPFLDWIAPQLATLVSHPPQGEDWLHEVKFDGYRILAFINNNTVTLKSRNNNEWTNYFPQIVNDLKGLKLNNAVLDGEVVILNEEGKSDFQLLQNSIKGKQNADFNYYIFDLLYYDQYNLMPLPLIERKELLRQLVIPNHDTLRYSDYIKAEGKEVFDHACKMGLEGIISKQAQTAYITKRSATWLKVKCVKRQEFVIGGFTKPKGKRTSFGSLLLGVFNNKGDLEYTGHVGTGFTEISLKEIAARLQQNLQDNCPFNTIPPESRHVAWVTPKLIAEVEFSAWTAEGILRHPSFKGLRLDKKATDIKKETPQLVTQDEVTMDNKPLKSSFKITHPEKIVYPEDHITKEELLNYYDFISPLMLPYVKNRALTLLRCPDNYNQCFYQRHFNKTTSKGLKAVAIESKGENEDYIYLSDKQGLLSLVQFGALEIHPWASTVDRIEQPDWITLDLDPADDVPWKKVVAAAFDIKNHLAQYQLTSFVKTTGGKGLHVVIPLKPKYDWDEIKNFTHVFVTYMEQLNPKEYISKMSKSARVGKIFIDYLRNLRSATAISVYSTRARLHAPISTPIDWDELSDDKCDTDFHIKNIVHRIQTQKSDPWKDFLKMQQVLPLEENPDG